MTPGLRDKWCAALESGQYVQGKRVLKTPADAMCCLGVLREVAEPGSVEGFGRHIENGVDFGPVLLTDDQQVQYGINHSVCITLANQNDGGKTFHEIAAWIRNHDPEDL